MNYRTNLCELPTTFRSFGTFADTMAFMTDRRVIIIALAIGIVLVVAGLLLRPITVDVAAGAFIIAFIAFGFGIAGFLTNLVQRRRR